MSASIIAAQRIKQNRVKKKSDSNEITSKMFKIEESLLNRFDLIFIMNEPKNDKNYKNELIDMVLNEAMGVNKEEETEWPRERITAHIAFAKTFGSIQFTPEVETILRKYFFFCTVHEDIPKWRTSARMYEGLRRITAAHTRLMLRRKTKIFDAITTILLSELSYPLGHLLDTACRLNDPLPGPDDETVEKILWLLKMPDDYYDIYEKEQSDMEDIENQLFNWTIRGSQNEQENAAEDVSMLENIMEVSNIAMVSTTSPSTSSSTKKPKTTKKQAAAKKTPQTGAKKKKAYAKAPIPNQFKRKLTTNDTRQKSNSPKKSKVEPLVNDAIISNLSSLAKAFEGPETTPTSNETRDKENQGNNFDKEVEDELKALQEFDLFSDL